MLTTSASQQAPYLARHEYLIRKYYAEHQRHFDPEIVDEELKQELARQFKRLVKRSALVFCVYIGIMFTLQSIAHAEEGQQNSGNTTVSCVGCIVSCDSNESCDYSI